MCLLPLLESRYIAVNETDECSALIKHPCHWGRKAIHKQKKIIINCNK